jgi:hypothetical protein
LHPGAGKRLCFTPLLRHTMAGLPSKSKPVMAFSAISVTLTVAVVLSAPNRTMK